MASQITDITLNLRVLLHPIVQSIVVQLQNHLARVILIITTMQRNQVIKIITIQTSTRRNIRVINLTKVMLNTIILVHLLAHVIVVIMARVNQNLDHRAQVAATLKNDFASRD